jgi:hypothetical protein
MRDGQYLLAGELLAVLAFTFAPPLFLASSFNPSPSQDIAFVREV